MGFLKKFAKKVEGQGSFQSIVNQIADAGSKLLDAKRKGFIIAENSKDGDFSNRAKKLLNKLNDAMNQIEDVASGLHNLQEKPEQ